MEILVRNSDNQIAFDFIENRSCDFEDSRVYCFFGELKDQKDGWEVEYTCPVCHGTDKEYREEHVDT